MSPVRYSIALCGLCCCVTVYSYAQQREYTETQKNKGNIQQQTRDTVIIKFGACKNSWIIYKEGESTITPEDSIENKVTVPSITKVPFLTIHGNVSYDYFYRSRMDTPVNQQNYQQHTERVYLDILVKGKYPFKAMITARQSNSPYFRDFVDVNFNFDKYSFQRNYKQQLLDKLNAVKSQIPKYADVAQLENKLKQYQLELEKTKRWVNDPGTLQKIVEEREKEYYTKLQAAQPTVPSADMAGFKEQISGLGIPGERRFGAGSENYVNISNAATRLQSKGDSLTGKVKEYYNKQKQKLDTLEQKVTVYKQKVDSARALMQKDIQSVRQKIYKTTSEKELQKLAEENGISADKRSKFEQRLSAIKTLSIGRSTVNYTELTAQNIILSGINVEYNPSYYVSFTAGKIDYRFRDFIAARKQRNNQQYLVMGRVGWGDKDKCAVILSVFTGRKYTGGLNTADSVRATQNILGYSVEGILKKNENTFLSAEFAKSTYPVAGPNPNINQSKGLWHLGDAANNGINIKAQTIITETNTKLSGFYRKAGEQFQSFSLFSYQTDQTAWLARADQSFFKDRVTLTGMLRRNDFSNPFTDKTYKTSTVFKTVQLNMRFKKMPSLSMGYFPGTQLYMVDRETIRESAYYILNASSSYSYRYKRVLFNSSLIYNKYTNESTDSGFIPYKGINWYVTQAAQLNRLQLQGGYAFTRLQELQYSTAEAQCGYEIKDWLSASGGLKYNLVKNAPSCWGEMLQLQFQLKKWGGFQLQYEKTWLPGITQQLMPVDMGRVSYYRKF